MILDYKKLPSDEHVTMWIGASGAGLGVVDVYEPLAAELNNTAGSGMIMASPSISWNDTTVVGVTSSETLSEPSLADVSTYVEFGTTNVDGSVSYFMPRAYDDASNLHSEVYDLTSGMREVLDFVARIDGAKKTSLAAADGDYVSVARAMSMSEDNPFAPGESVRRTVGYTGKGGFSHYTIVGLHSTLVGVPKATDPWKAGSAARLRAEVQGRDYTNAVRFSSSDPAVVEIYPGGFYKVTGAAGGTATITITDTGTGDTATVSVTVTA